ncbi:hypothetical protein R3P38DRAFT_3234012 [Favolaschia claudopus]|uniref:Uncharacterized protein n=1 Tax=Favolaschia claudopus TaxID=2862362 RepID=A0AAV9ZGP4_9AGAR
MRFAALFSLVVFAAAASALPAEIAQREHEPLNTCIRSGEHYINPASPSPSQPVENRFQGVKTAAKVGEPEAFKGLNA